MVRKRPHSCDVKKRNVPLEKVKSDNKGHMAKTEEGVQLGKHQISNHADVDK